MFFGRTDEIAQIDRLLDAARDGVSAALIVRGDPGIGKTALAEVVAAHATGFTVIRTQALQSESELPFAGLYDLLRPLLPRLDRIPAPQAAVLAGALALGPPTPGDRFAAAAATISLLAVGSTDAPLLAIVDDAHWLDTPSREALLFAGRRLGTEGVVLLLTMRDRAWLMSAGIERLELGGLTADAAAALVTGSGRTISALVRKRLIADTAGNPLALLESVSSLTDDQLSGSAPITGPVTLGSSLERSFALHLEPLSRHARSALLIAAASDNGDAHEIGRAMVRLGLSASALEEAERRALITNGPDLVVFRHPLIRAAVYHEADPGDRRITHRELAAVLRPDASDRIAWHLAAAAEGPDERVARLLEDSAVSAYLRGGYSAAANAQATAARLSPLDSDRVRRTMAAANAYRLGGEGATAEELLVGIVDLATDAEQRADIQQLRASAQMFVRPLGDIFSFLVGEADRIEVDQPERAATMLAIAANAVVGVADVRVYVDTGSRAWILARTFGGPVEVLASLVYSNGLALAGRVSEARELLDPLLPLLDTVDPLGETGFLVVTATHTLSWVEELDLASQMLERVILAARSASAITVMAYPLAVLAEIDLRCGRTAAAYAAATESVQLAEECGQGVQSSFSLVTLARVEAIIGREAACRGHLAHALTVAREFGVTATENYASAVLGLLELSLGHPERAIAPLRESARSEARHGVGIPTAVPWRGDYIEAHIRTGSHADALRELDALEEQAHVTGSMWAAAVAARCRGMVADDERYEAIFALALELHGDREPFERARTELGLGRRRRHSRHRAAARAALHGALATFEELGAEPWAEQARIELRATGESPSARRTGSLMSLTPQELQVALIVAGGATNKEAAAALFISPKTVEFHLGHVYAKLGVRSRSELVRRVAGLA